MDTWTGRFTIELYEKESVSVEMIYLYGYCDNFNYLWSTYSVWNVSQVKINDNIEFPTTDDHSKWGVGDSKQNWICVGDINRAVNSISIYIIVQDPQFYVLRMQSAGYRIQTCRHIAFAMTILLGGHHLNLLISAVKIKLPQIGA